MSSINNNVRWGFIGCGAVTEVKSGPAFQLADGFEVTTVMRRDHDAARDYAARHDVPFYTDNAAELIESEAVDAVYIATPPDSHLLYALQVAAVGKPCYIEKPLAPTYQACEQIVEAFARANTPLMVAYYRRSLPRFLKIKALLDAGVIGRPHQVNWQYKRPLSPLDQSGDYQWRTDVDIARGGYFDDLACHGLDIFAYLFDRFQSVDGVHENRIGCYSAADFVSANWQHQSGVSGTASWDFAANDYKDDVQVVGDKGVLRFTIFGESAIQVEAEYFNDQILIEKPVHIQQPHIQAMQKSLTDGRAFSSTGETALHTSWVMEAILGGL